MKAAAKYLFDESFASGEKPTITMVEHERRRVDGESQAYRTGFTAGEAQAQQDAAQRTAAALAVIGDGLARLDGALTAIETRLETETVEVAVAVAAKLAPALTRGGASAGDHRPASADTRPDGQLTPVPPIPQ